MIIIVQAGEPTSLPCDDQLRAMRSVYLSQALNEMGSNVVVIAPNFSHQKRANRFTEKRTVCEDADGIEYRLLFSFGYVDNLSIRRFFDHLVFGCMVFLELFRLKLIEKGNIEAVYVGYPQVEPAFFAVLFSKITKIRCIVDFKDDWPEMFRYGGYDRSLPLSLLYHYYRLQFNFVARFCDGWTTITEHFEDLMLSRSKFLSSKQHTVSSLTSKNKRSTGQRLAISPNKRNPKKISKMVYLLFAGTLSASVYDFLTLKNLLIKSKYNFRITFAGGGPELENVLALMESNNIQVDFKSWLDEHRLNQIYLSHDYFIVPVSNRIDFVSSFPNKFIDGVSAGLLPFVPLGSAMGELCNRYNVGVCYSDNLDGHEFDKLIEANSTERKEQTQLVEKMLDEKFDHSKNYSGLAKFVRGQ